jgi:hypothetical protein
LIIPNKVISVQDSVVGHIGVIMRHAAPLVDVAQLYADVSDQFESIDQFLLALDVLFVLGRIELLPHEGAIQYAG